MWVSEMTALPTVPQPLPNQRVFTNEEQQLIVGVRFHDRTEVEIEKIKTNC